MSKKFKSIIATTLAVSTVAPVVPIVQAEQQFADVTEQNSHYAAILQLAEREIIKGYPDGTFKPYQSVSRGQAAKIIAGILQLDTTEKVSQFSDVREEYEHSGAINALRKEGIIDGYSDGTFKPSNPITRAQMAKILANAFKLQQPEAINIPFTDVRLDGEFAPYIQALYNNGITRGTTATTYSPLANVTRGQLATFVVSAEKKEKATTITVERIEDGVIYDGTEQYSISNKLAAVLSTENAAALAGAKLEVELKGDEITSISTLELNTFGTAEAPVVFNGHDIVLHNVKVNADYVELKNIEVLDAITVTEKAKTQLALTTTIVKDTVMIESGAPTQTAALTATALENFSLKVADSVISTVDANRESFTLISDTELETFIVNEAVKQLQLMADVHTLIILNKGIVEVSGDSKVQTIEVENTPHLYFNIATEIAKLVIKQVAAKIMLGDQATVDLAIIPDGAQLMDIMPESSEQVKMSQSASEAAGTLPTEQVPGVGGGAGGGVGSSTPPAVQATITQIDDVAIYLGYKQPFELAKDLPKEIKAQYSDQTEKLVAVTWALEEGAAIDTSTDGELKLAGTVEGYTPEVNLTITVGPAKVHTLNTKLTAANNLAKTIVSETGEEVLPTVKWTTAEALEALTAAIAEAAKVAVKENLTYPEVAEAEDALAQAIQVFEAALKDGATAATDEVKAQIIETELALQSVVTGETAADVAYDQHYVTAEQKATLQAALDAMKKAVEQAEAKKLTKQAFQAELAQFQAALAAFEAAYKANVGTKVDTAALGEVIAQAEVAIGFISTDGTDVVPTAYWTTAEVHAVFKAALDDAKTVFHAQQLTPEDVKQALQALTAAIEKYKATQQLGATPKTDELEEQLATIVTEVAALPIAVDTSTIEFGKPFMTKADHEAIEAVLATIQAVLEQAKEHAVTVQQFNTAAAEFNEAVTLFKASIAHNTGQFVDKTALQDAITAVTKAKVAASADGKDILPTSQWTPVEALEAFEQAIEAAQAEFTSASSEPTTVQAALDALAEALAIYEKHVQQGVTPNIAEAARTVDDLQQQLADVTVADHAQDVAYGKVYVTAAQKAAIDAALVAMKEVLEQAAQDELTANAFEAAAQAFEAAVMEFDVALDTQQGTYMNKTVLQDAITAAQNAIVATSVDGKDILPTAQWTPAEALAALEQAIEAAQVEFASASSEPSTVQDAIDALALAEVLYETQVKQGVTPNTQASSEAIADVEQRFTDLAIADSAQHVAYGKAYATQAQKVAIDAALVAMKETLTQAARGELTANAFDAAAQVFNEAVAEFVEAIDTQQGTFVDKTALMDAINEATVLLQTVVISADGAEVTGEQLWITVEQHELLTDAVAAAQTTATNEQASDVEVAEAIAAIEAAITSFESAVQNGLAVDRTSLQAAIQAVEASYVAVASSADEMAPHTAWTTEAEKQAIVDAVELAKTVVTTRNVTQQQLAEAEQALQQAFALYKEAAHKVGAAFDLVSLTNAIEAAEASFVATSVDGTDVSSLSKWTTAEAKVAFEAAIAEAKVAAITTKAQLEQVEQALQAALQAYSAALQAGLKAAIVISGVALDLTASVNVDIFVEQVKVTTATLASTADGQLELTFAQQTEGAFDLTTLGEQFTFTLKGITFVVKNDNGWHVAAKPLAKPANVQVVNGSTIEVKWDAVDGAAEYAVSRIDQDGTLHDLGKVTAPSIKDLMTTMGEKYIYKVMAMNEHSTSEAEEAVIESARLQLDGVKYYGDYVVITNGSSNYQKAEAFGQVKSNESFAPNLQGANADLPTESYQLNPTLDSPTLKKDLQEQPSSAQNILASLQTVPYKIGDSRTFTVSTSAYLGAQFAALPTTLVAAGEKVQVWVAKNEQRFKLADAQALVQEFEQNMYGLVTENFGAVSDFDNNGKIDLVIFDYQDGYSGAGSGYVGGYYTSADRMPKSQNATSNEGDILYIDTYPSMMEGNTFKPEKAYSTVVHELQHLVNYYQQHIEEPSPMVSGGIGMANWLNEGLSMAAEQLYLQTKTTQPVVLDSRIDYFNRQMLSPSHSLWNFDGNQNGLLSYAMSYLFLQYLLEQTNAGTQLYKDLMQYSEELVFEDETFANAQYEMAAFSDREAINALQSVLNKYMAGMTVNDFVTSFYIALLAQEEEGLYGFKGKITNLTPRPFSGQTTGIYGGAGMIIQASNRHVDATNSGANVQHAGVYVKQ